MRAARGADRGRGRSCPSDKRARWRRQNGPSRLLIRPQAENTNSPGVLWVAFELGPPFGPPSDAAFQRRVSLEALGLLERRHGPVRIEDFPEEDRRVRPTRAGHLPFPRPGRRWAIGW